MSDDATVRLLEQLVAAQPANWEARGHLAKILLERGNAARAEELLSGGPPMPDDAALRLLLGEVLSRTSPDRAIVHYRDMVLRDKRCARAYLGLARIYRSRGMREEARQPYSLATVLDESLEDPQFRAWLDGEPAPPAPAPPPTASRHPEDRIGGTPDEEEEENGNEALSEELDDPAPAFEPPAPALPPITFRDVGGMEDVKERIRMNIIYPARNPALFQKFKKRPGGGILLYGPPGCGKTYLARATAGECGATFSSVGITDVLSKWVGESERRLHELFELARRRTPTVIFMDELDALGMSRHDARGSAMTTVINQLLIELDGIHSRNENLMVLAATNAPWSVDAAFRRPGRFDRVVFVPPPDAAARRAVFEIHLRDLPHERIDLDKLAQGTRHFSGADIRAAVELASERAIYEEMKSGRPGQVTLKSLLAAVKETRPSTLEWLETAKNYASYGNRAGQYDDLVRYFEKGE
jgi:SpoVK/Ycf46/Vps4 family AAA+-type ATPase